MICMICHDSDVELFKICFCNESLVCKSCLQTLNYNRTNLCPICREPLRVGVTSNSNKKIKLLSTITFFVTLISLINVFPIFHFINVQPHINSTSLFYNKSFQYATTSVLIFMIHPLIYLYLNDFFTNREPLRIIKKDATFYISVLTISNFVYSMVYVVNGIDQNFFLYYFASICIPFYILPFVIILVNLLLQYILNVKDLIEEFSLINLIQIQETIAI